MELNVQDSHMQKPIHYAACCESSAPLELLISKGASVFDLNSGKMTPLHLAALNGRAENITAILKSQRAVFKLRDHWKITAFAYALELGEIAPI